MPSAAKLLCVAPPDVEQYWPAVEHLLRRAIERVGLSDFDDVTSALFTGSHLLWIATEDDEVAAACTTELRKINDHLICVIVACGGAGMPKWLHLISQIEDYAKAEGCKSMKIIGRPGWERVLDGFHREYAILEKAL